jgi:hypothetical protein
MRSITLASLLLAAAALPLPTRAASLPSQRIVVTLVVVRPVEFKVPRAAPPPATTSDPVGVVVAIPPARAGEPATAQPLVFVDGAPPALTMNGAGRPTAW